MTCEHLLINVFEQDTAFQDVDLTLSLTLMEESFFASLSIVSDIYL